MLKRSRILVLTGALSKMYALARLSPAHACDCVWVLDASVDAMYFSTNSIVHVLLLGSFLWRSVVNNTNSGLPHCAPIHNRGVPHDFADPDTTLRWRGFAPTPVALAHKHRVARTRRFAALGARERRFAAVDTPAVVIDPHALRWRQRQTDHLA